MNQIGRAIRLKHHYALKRCIAIPNEIDIQINLGAVDKVLNPKSKIFFQSIEKEEWINDTYLNVLNSQDFIPYGLIYRKNDKMIYFDVNEFKYQVRLSVNRS
jgi:hypothetical protein